MDATIRFNIDASGVPGQLAQAEQKMRSFSDRVGGLFKAQGGSGRSQRALGGFVSALATGNVEGAIVGISERMRGLGLAAGVGIGAAAVIAKKFYDQIQETAKATAELKKELASPLSLESSLSSEGISALIKAKDESTAKLHEDRGNWMSKFYEAVNRQASPDIYNTATGEVESGNKPGRKSAAQKEELAGQMRVVALMAARAKSESELTDIKEHALRLSSEDAAIEKIRLTTSQANAALRLDSRNNPRNAASNASLILNNDRAARIEIEREQEKAAAKKETIDLENKILSIKEGGGTADEKALETQRAKVASLLNELNAATNIENKSKLSAQLRGAQDELNRNEFAHRNDPGSAVSTPERRAEALYQHWVRNLNKPFSRYGPYANNPGAYARSPDAYGRQGSDVGGENEELPQGGRVHDWSNFTKLFPPSKRPRVLLNDDTNAFYKGMFGNDAGDLERGPMGTNQLGYPQNAMSRFIGGSWPQPASMLLPSRSTTPQPDQTMTSVDNPMQDLSKAASDLVVELRKLNDDN